jgi:hypothetical protein
VRAGLEGYQHRFMAGKVLLEGAVNRGDGGALENLPVGIIDHADE